MATKKYLSLDRLTEYDALIKSTIDEKVDTVKNDLLNGAGEAYDTLKELGELIDENADALEALETVATGKADKEHTHVFTLPYGVCESAPDAGVKVVDVGDFSLEEGAAILVKFKYANSYYYSSPSLNVSNTGNKPMYRYGTKGFSYNEGVDGWNSGSVMLLVYDGTGWISDYWNNTTYTNKNLGHDYIEINKYVNSIHPVIQYEYGYSARRGGVISVKFSEDVSEGAQFYIELSSTASTDFHIYYRGSAITDGIIKAGDIATFMFDGSYYHLISIDRWQADITNLQNLESLELITVDDIDTICGTSIEVVSMSEGAF